MSVERDRLLSLIEFAQQSARLRGKPAATVAAHSLFALYEHEIQALPGTLRVDLSDGRSISIPLAWYPRLLRATPAERKRGRLIGRGLGIHWADLDEDISVEGLPAGKPSGESQASFGKWLAARSTRPASRPARARARPTRAV